MREISDAWRDRVLSAEVRKALEKDGTFAVDLVTPEEINRQLERIASADRDRGERFR